MKSRTDVINYLFATRPYKTYLEIGVDNPDLNFNHVAVPTQFKTGVDPAVTFPNVRKMPSDEFFAECAEHVRKWDVIFIDGDHSAGQAYRDMQNALLCLSPGGTIVVHDVSPPTEESQFDTMQPIWCGGVWKAWVKLRQECPKAMAVLDADYGVGVIQDGQGLRVFNVPESLTWAALEADRAQLLNLLPADVFKIWLDHWAGHAP